LKGTAALKGGLFVLLALGGACAHAPGRPREITLDPIEVRAGDPESVALAALNADELFEVGTAAFAAGNYERAARAFETLIAGPPAASAHTLDDAHYNAGLAWERMGESLRALRHFLPLMDHTSGEAWASAALRAAENLYHLEAYEDAAEILHTLAERSRSDPALRIEALVKEAVCRLELGDDAGAETRLRQALGRWTLERREDETRIDPFYPAQATFFLGEVYRLRFEAHPFDPSAALDRLEADLGEKTTLLLTAQGYYLRAIRLGEARWAAAAGYELGRLYEVFYRQMMRARFPDTLRDPAERLAYQQLLQREIRALLEKALGAYERTLAATERLGLRGRWRERIEAGLERVRSLLLEAPATPGPPDPPDVLHAPGEANHGSA
jgi:tetratricopeptide (TPR) repeat protein